MRRIYLVWSIAVFGVIGTVYGAYSLIYASNHGKELPIYGILLLIFGSIALITFLVLYIISFIQEKKRKKNKPAPTPTIEEIVAEEEAFEPTIEEVKSTPSRKSEPKEEEYEPRPQRTYSSSSSSYYASTAYVKEVGYGPLLRVEGNRIIDMRTNTYYRIENNMVMQDGYGPVFEIRVNQIKDAFGGYLYEISGSNINRVFGGYYASISGNYITLFDLSKKYEMTDSLSKRQILVVAALLFGKY